MQCRDGFLCARTHRRQTAGRADANLHVLLVVLEQLQQRGNGLVDRLIALPEAECRGGANAGVLVLERLIDVRKRFGRERFLERCELAQFLESGDLEFGRPGVAEVLEVLPGLCRLVRGHEVLANANKEDGIEQCDTREGLGESMHGHDQLRERTPWWRDIHDNTVMARLDRSVGRKRLSGPISLCLALNHTINF